MNTEDITKIRVKGLHSIEELAIQESGSERLESGISENSADSKEFPKKEEE